MVKGIIAVAPASFLVVLYCYFMQGGREDEMMEDMHQKKARMAAGKDEK